MCSFYIEKKTIHSNSEADGVSFFFDIATVLQAAAAAADNVSQQQQQHFIHLAYVYGFGCV